MKNVFSVAAFLFLSTGSVCAQPVHHEKIGEFDLIYLMNRVEVLGEVANDTLSVRVLSVGNLPGSAGFDSGEITHTVYVGISEYDDLPEQSLFRLPDLLVPKLERIDKKELALYISYGLAQERSVVRIEPSLVELHLEEINHP